eukprot:scaffold15282_cov166-Amphora_coffeaeformis.AAC.1
MEIVNFIYDQQSLCSDSDNAQVNTFSEMSITQVYCEDLGTLQQTVSMECVDSTTQAPVFVTPQSFEAGDSVAVHTNDGTTLPSEIICTISSGGQELQRNWITLSSNFRLHDKFGALQVLACGEKHCMHEATATYSITNDGSSTLEVVKCSRDMTGKESESFLSKLPTNPLPVGASSTASEKIMLNICSYEPIEISVDAEAEPEDGPKCTANPSISIVFDPTPTATPTSSPTSQPTATPTSSPSTVPSSSPSASPSSTPTASPTSGPTDSPSSNPTIAPTRFLHPTQSPTETDTPTKSPTKSPTTKPSATPSVSPTSAPTNSQCSVIVDMECVTSDGKACADIVPPVPLCSPEFEMINFLYDFESTCAGSENTQDDDASAICIDFGTLVEQVKIECFDVTSATALPVEPSIVNAGETFAIFTTDGTLIPQKVRCNVNDPTGEPLQTNLIDMSGPLRLNEKFGSLQLRSCGDNSCTREAMVSIAITNDGNDGFTVVSASRLFNGEDSKSVLPLPLNPLAVGQSTSVNETVKLDTCSGEPIVITTTVQAEPESGLGCGSSPSITINLDPAPTAEPSSSPTGVPTTSPTTSPTYAPSTTPSSAPSFSPTSEPSSSPSSRPINSPTASPTGLPTKVPTPEFTENSNPSTTASSPTESPDYGPTKSPSESPTAPPTKQPTPEIVVDSTTFAPTKLPSMFPTKLPSAMPSVAPTMNPTNFPTRTPMTDDGCKPAYVYCRHSSTCFLDTDFNGGNPVVDAIGDGWGWSIFLGVGSCNMHCSIFMEATSCDTAAAEMVVINEYSPGEKSPWPQGYSIFPLATPTRQYLSIALN